MVFEVAYNVILHQTNFTLKVLFYKRTNSLYCSPGDIDWNTDEEFADDAKQLIIRLLEEDPERRLGS